MGHRKDKAIITGWGDTSYSVADKDKAIVMGRGEY